MPEFNTFFPTSLYGDDALNVMSFGAFGDGVARPLSSLTAAHAAVAPHAPYANLAAAQVDYPSATALSDYADWCGITECVKQCFYHETSPGSGVWVPNGSSAFLNKPMCFPKGRYRTNKPVLLDSLTGAIIRGTGYVQIFNETTTAPNNIGVIIENAQSCRIDNIDMQSNGGTDAVGLLIEQNSTGIVFYNCNFYCGPSSNSIGCHIGNPLTSSMGSEMTFIKCTASFNNCGFVIDNPNALNYQFLACGGMQNALQWMRVNTGGMVVIENASLADNGTNNINGYDIYNFGGNTLTVIGTRTESRKFVQGKDMTLIGCLQASEGADVVFCDAQGATSIVNCQSTYGRVCGNGPINIDQSSTFSINRYPISNIASGTGGRVRLTHGIGATGGTGGHPVFYDGDEVAVEGVVSANTTSAGGAAHTNGVWIIAKIDNTHLELIGSSFVSDTYTYTNAVVGLGPQGHLRDVLFPTPGVGQVSHLLMNAGTMRLAHDTRVRDYDVLPGQSGTTFDNYRATGPVVFTLPNTQFPSWADQRGTIFRFTVMENQTLTIKVNPAVTIPSTTRIFEAGAYASAGTQISCSGANIIGSMVELVLADGGPNIPHDQALLSFRWLVRSKTGTWTISGTP